MCLLLQGTKQKTEGDAEYKAAQAKGYGEFGQCTPAELRITAFRYSSL